MMNEPGSASAEAQSSTNASEAQRESRPADTQSTVRAAKRPARNPRERTPGLPGAGPTLPPTAQRLLDAAHRLLARSGYNSLSVEAIGREAGENKALVRYYFGSKNGLLLALVDELVSETMWQARQRFSALSTQQDRARLVVETLEAILGDSESYRLLYEILPRLLENPSMASKLADLYRIYRNLNAEALWGDRADEPPGVVRDVAAMTVALTDGLALQLLAEPGCIDVARALTTWRLFVEGVLASASKPAPDVRPVVWE